MVMLFLRKRFKQKKENRAKGAGGAPVDVGVQNEAPPCDSYESSEVEYIEDDENLLKAVLPPTAPHVEVKATPPPDGMLPLSVTVPTDMIDGENDSNLSLEGVLIRPPQQLFAEKPGKASSRFSINTSATSETQPTVSASENTYSEVGSITTTSEKHEKEKKRLERWRATMEDELRRLGTKDPRAVVILLELGSTYLQFQHYEIASNFYSEAIEICEALFDGSDLRLAKAMEMFGVAESSNPKNKHDQEKLRNALSFLDKAYAIRFDRQGPKHVDTVSSLSRVASALTKLKRYEEARGCFYEVMKLREAIYGRHPSAACSARALALMYTKLSDLPKAKYYFNHALKIHEENGLEHHSVAGAIRKELSDLKHIKARVEI